MQQYAIGVDIGTGSTKAVAINDSGEVIAVSQFHYYTNNPQRGYSEQDPEVIWKAFVNSLQAIIGKMVAVPAVISLSSCMHSLIVIDNNLDVITNLITWADTRSEKIADEIRRSTEAEKIYKATGTPIHSMSPLCKIIWLKENASAIFKNAFKFISIKEFIWHKLFNAWQVDHSIASATGLFNIENFKWNNASLKSADISQDQLSHLVPTNFIRKDLISSAASLLNIPDDIPFCIGASDGCLANIGSNAIEPGIAAVTIGTSGAVRIANFSPVFNFKAMIFNYVLDKKTFICGGPVNNGGNVVQWVFKTLLDIPEPGVTDYEEFFKVVDAVPSGCNGLLFLPYLNGERSPLWDEKACGCFFGIRSHHINTHFMRAALEGICYALKNVLQTVEKSTNNINQLNVSGGFVHSKTWMQILADITGKKVCLIQTEDASAIGAALLGTKAMNLQDHYLIQNLENNLLIEPDLDNHELHKKYYDIFKNLYEPLKGSMHQLHNIANL